MDGWYFKKMRMSRRSRSITKRQLKKVGFKVKRVVIFILNTRVQMLKSDLPLRGNQCRDKSRSDKRELLSTRN